MENIISRELLNCSYPFYLREGNKIDYGHAVEVISQDCYDMYNLHEWGLKPEIIFDLGASCGDFASLCSFLWPKANIYSLDMDKKVAEVFAKNAPYAKLDNDYVTACLAMREEDLYFIHEEQIRQHAEGNPDRAFVEIARKHLDSLNRTEIDILKMDVEGMEVNIIKELKALGWLPNIKVITGEWHYAPALNYLKAALADTHTFYCIKDGYWNIFGAVRKDLKFKFDL